MNGLVDTNIMELWLFDTCNFRCGYCSLVENGAVKRVEQLVPFRDVEYIDRLLRFFAENRPGNRNWVVQLTGGEPMMMPNIDRFVRGLGSLGDKAAIYTNGAVPFDTVLSEEALPHLAYVQMSFHPDWHVGTFSQDKFFKNLEFLHANSVPGLVRFVGAPKAMKVLPELKKRCEEIGIGFLPTTLFDPHYPKAYTPEEREELASYMSGYSSLIQLDGGVLMVNGRKCQAADRLYAARLHQGGDVTPCISTMAPVLGNIFTGKLKSIPGSKPCYKMDRLCTCDVHFQFDIVEGVSDSADFTAILNGESRPRAAGYEEWKDRHGIVVGDDIWAGQGTVAHLQRGLVIRK